MKKSLFLLLPFFLLSGCSTSQETLLPVDGNTTMLNLWNQRAGGAQALNEQRSQLRRPVVDPQALIKDQHSYTRTAANEIQSQFVRLPNPDLVMYIWPHLTGDSPVPVPGYSTVFPFYTQVQYAQPGERVEAL
ncbi:TIGR03751 family conjugal transfer lipoprotein [Salmonella enterica subsp. enterica]|nr:TIGR03751 family conjugal transfer lipoprotein [Salmonella enterica subsp. enterica]MIF51120.1 TIGR03751 family conjugal transfer lipoprotein [Salmonella enterica subsp. enterica]